MQRPDWFAVLLAIFVLGAGAYLSTFPTEIIREFGLVLMALAVAGLLIWFGLGQRHLKVNTWGPWALIIGGPLLGAIWLLANHYSKPVGDVLTGYPLAFPQILGLQFQGVDNGPPVAKFATIYAINNGKKEIELKDAFLISGITGDRINMIVGLHPNGPRPADVKPIVPDQKFYFLAQFNGDAGISIPEFIRQWSKIYLVVQYGDTEYRPPMFDLESEVRKVAEQALPKAPEPMIQRR